MRKKPVEIVYASTLRDAPMSVEVSVIIPTFRRPAELREAVLSVLSQPEVDLEVIVVDDSPEGSAQEVIDAIADQRVTYLKNPKPTGGVVSKVRNLAWPKANGTYIHFLDDDDIVPQGHYDAVKTAFSAHPEVGMVFGRIDPFGNCTPEELRHEQSYFADAATRAAKCQKFGPRWAFVGRMLFESVLLVCSASVLRRECVHRLGGFDPEIRFMEDGDFHVRAMRMYGAHFMDRIVLHYRVSSPSFFMRSSDPDRATLIRDAWRRTLAKYRKQRGPFEYYLLAVFARALRLVDKAMLK
jgi:glycosyltransferase involved in cell wall biosynthesis